MKLVREQNDRVARAVNYGKQPPGENIPWWRCCNPGSLSNWGIFLGGVLFYLVLVAAYISCVVFMFTSDEHQFLWVMLGIISTPFAVPLIFTFPGLMLDDVEKIIRDNRKRIQKDRIQEKAAERQEREEMLE